MAATLVETKVIQLSQSEALVFGTVTGDSSYPTGGYALDPPGSTDYESFVASPSGGTTAASVAGWVPGTKKLMAYGSNGAAPAQLVEIANTTNLSAQVWEFVAVRPT
jgi:hypothetical protein